MNIEELNNKVLIIKDKSKNFILKKLNLSNKLINVKIITLNELLKKYYFDYSKKTIVYICKKYNVIYDVAELYIKNMYYINENTFDEKTKFLLELKNELFENKLISNNKQFINYLKNKDIIIYDCKNVDKMYKNIFNELNKNNNIKYIDEENKLLKHDLFKCNNMEEEISFVASKICDLVLNGININDIYLANVNNDYIFTIETIFKLFNIPININKSISYKGSIIVNEFKKNFNNDINITLNSIKKYISTDDDKDLYNKIINVINEYAFIDDLQTVKELIFYDIDNLSKKEKTLKNAVNIADINNEIFSDNEYVFLINYNEGSIPKEIKDEDYISDKIKEKLNVSTSYELNTLNLNNLINKISNIKNLIVTYSNYNGSEELYISSSYKEELFDMKIANIDFNHSNKYNQIKLVSYKDEYNKFGTINDNLILLNDNYKNQKYLSYDNKYTKVSKEDLYEYLNNDIKLSYSSLNNYYNCSFKYYLNDILKINKFESTFDTTIGNVFHKILSECFTDNYDLDKRYEEVINEQKYEFTISEKYFVKKLKKELEIIISTIKNQLNYTSLKKFMYEKNIEVLINENPKVIFKGFIDKVIYDEIDGEKICFIVDYKTGKTDLKIDNCQFGLNMQLPCYVYLIKNEIKDIKIGGFYLQNILNPSNTEEEKINNLKLQGFSNSNKNVLKYVDSSYEKSNMIKSLNVKLDGDFTANSKILSDDDIELLYNMISNNINNACKDILEAKFDINPKQIKDEIVGCKYCEFKDICYMNNKDIVKIENIKKIFGGDDNDNMD